MTDAMGSMPKILAMVRSIPKKLGTFDTVEGHEPLNAPGNGLHCYSWAGPVRCVGTESGLASAALVASFSVRIQTLAAGPKAKGVNLNNIDRKLLHGTGVLFNAYIGHFRLTDHTGQQLVRRVDIFGSYGAGLRMDPGYLNSDGNIYRVGVITLPLILNDEYDEVE
jgi:hypothetical protein